MALSPKMIRSLKRKVSRSPRPRLETRMARRKMSAKSRLSKSPKKIRSRSPVKRVVRKSSPQFKTKWQIEHQSMGIGPLRRNQLSKYGYHTNIPENKRDEALDKAVKEYGALSVFRKLNALAVYNKNRAPRVASIAKHDRDVVKQTYM